MAKNRYQHRGRKVFLNVAAVNGSGVANKVLSGDPGAVGQLPFVALIDEDTAGSATCDTLGVYELSVNRGFADVVLAVSAALDDIVDTTTPHGFVAGNAVKFTGLVGGAGLVNGTTYYVIAGNLAANTFQVAAAAGGAAINFTTDITAGSVNFAKSGLVQGDIVYWDNVAGELNDDATGVRFGYVMGDLAFSGAPAAVNVRVGY